jgi:hypothetical protein
MLPTFYEFKSAHASISKKSLSRRRGTIQEIQGGSTKKKRKGEKKKGERLDQ